MTWFSVSDWAAIYAQTNFKLKGEAREDWFFK